MTDNQPEIRKGLAGVVADVTAVSKVVQETNSLTYRGYAVQDLCESASFEEVSYLLWYGELPTEKQLELLTLRERAARRAPRSLLALIAKLPENCHPMDVVRTAVSWLGAEDPEAEDREPRAIHEKALRMWAVLPTVVAADMRRRRGLEPIAPHPTLGFAANFLHMCFGEQPDPRVARAFEQSLILYAEHGFNASTFAARVVTSTQSDVYSAVTAAIGALKGNLHGGANEAVMHNMDEIGSPDRAAEWLQARLAAKDKIMGFGHRVYKNGDSRVPTMKKALDDVVEVLGGADLLKIYDILDRGMNEATGIRPNLDFPAGPAYHLMGFDTEVFTPIFVMARIVGWTAHIVEQVESNSLIRPLSVYNGVAQRELPA